MITHLYSSSQLSLFSPKVGSPTMLSDSVTRLRRLIGIQFEYKIELQNLLQMLLTASSIIADYDEPGNTPALRGQFVNTFIGCGASMKFEAKRAAYGALELITAAVAADDDVSANNSAALNALLVNTTRFVGMEEGDGEDFHFMVAVYDLVAKLVEVIENTTVFGGIATLTLLTNGTGILVDSEDPLTDTAEGVVFVASSTESSNPTNYVAGEVTAEIVDGEIDSLTLISDSGEGFFVGQVVELEISTTTTGQTAAVQTTAATAVVDSIID